MRRIIIFAIVLTLGMLARAQKTAHIDFEALVSYMPQTKKLKTDIEKLTKTYTDEIKSAQTKLQAKAEKYRAEQNSQTVAQNEKRSKELQTEQVRLQQLSQTAQQDIASKQESGYKPIIDKARSAVEKVAKSKGIIYVLPKGSLVYAGGEDLLPAVKKELGIK